MSDQEDLLKQAQRVLDELTPREREILEQRFGIKIDPNAPLSEVLTQFDITRAKIRKMERRARKRLGLPDDPDELT